MLLGPGNHDENGVLNDVTGGNKRVDVQHSIFGNHQQRAPRLRPGSGVLVNDNLIFHGTNWAITMVGADGYNVYHNFVDNLGMRMNSVLGSGFALHFGMWAGTPGPGSMIYCDGNIGMTSPAGTTANLGPRTTGWAQSGAVISDALFEDALVAQTTPAGFTRWAGVTADQRFDYLRANAGARPADLVSGARVDPVSQAFLTEIANKVGIYKNGPPTSYPLPSTTRAIADTAWNTSTALLNSVATWRGQVELASRSIGVNLSDTANALAATDVVGAVQASKWNNSTAANQVMTNVVDNTGAATTTDVTFGNTGFSYNNNTAVLAAPMTDDAKMMRSQRGAASQSTMTAAVAQVPYATYDVYVYWGGRTPQEPVPMTMTVNFQLWNGTAWVTNATKYIKDANHVWDGTYNESTATSAAAAVDGNEYVVFRNVTATTFRISSTSGIRTGICGFQIVKR